MGEAEGHLLFSFQKDFLKVVKKVLFFSCQHIYGRHDTQHNGTQPNDI